MGFIRKHRLFVTLISVWQIVFLGGIPRFSLSLFPSAFAQEAPKAKKPRIAVIDIGGKTDDENVRKNIVKTVRQTFSNLTDLRTVSDERVTGYVMGRQNVDTGSARERLRKGFKLLRDGKEAYNRMNMKEAAERLSLAKKEFIAGLNELKTNGKFLETYLYLGMANSAMGKKDEAYSEFKKALYLDDKIHMSPKDYSPEVIREFERAKRDITELPKGTVLFDSVPSGANVYVNAKDIGVTPLNVLYPVGEYFVKIVKEGYLDWYQLVSVEDRINTIEIELAPIAADDELLISLKPVTDPGNADADTMALLKDVSSKLKCDYVFLGWIERSVRDMIAGQLYDAKNLKFSPISQSSMGKNFSNVDFGIQKMVNELKSTIDKDGTMIAMQELKDEPIQLLPPTKPPTPEEIRAKKKQQWYNKWWVWAIAGGIAAGAGVGIYYGVKANDANGITVINKGNF